MNRRRLMGTLGLCLLPGCTSRFSLTNETRPADSPVVEPLPAVRNPTSPTPQSPPIEETLSEPNEFTPVEEESPVPIEERDVSAPTEPDADTPDRATLTEEELYGLERLRTADRRFTSAVQAFTGEYGDKLTDVSATSLDFGNSIYGIRIALAKAQEGYTNAADSAANRDQQIQAEQMVRCWQFLHHTTQTQSAVVESCAQLMDLIAALERDSAETATKAASNLEVKQRIAARRNKELLGSSSAQDMIAITSISEAQHMAKTAQLSADISVYADLDDVLRDSIEGVQWLRRGKAWLSPGSRNVRQAKDAAEEARDNLRSARKKLDSLRETTDDNISLEPAVLSLRTTIINKTQESLDILNR
jgi:hypothetical protein